jgi:hypothetical protein
MNAHQSVPSPAAAEVYSFPPAEGDTPSKRNRWLKPGLIALAVALAGAAAWQAFGPAAAPPAALRPAPCAAPADAASDTCS